MALSVDTYRRRRANRWVRQLRNEVVHGRRARSRIDPRDLRDGRIVGRIIGYSVGLAFVVPGGPWTGIWSWLAMAAVVAIGEGLAVAPERLLEAAAKRRSHRRQVDAVLSDRACVRLIDAGLSPETAAACRHGIPHDTPPVSPMEAARRWDDSVTERLARGDDIESLIVEPPIPADDAEFLRKLVPTPIDLDDLRWRARVRLEARSARVLGRRTAVDGDVLLARTTAHLMGHRTDPTIEAGVLVAHLADLAPVPDALVVAAARLPASCGRRMATWSETRSGLSDGLGRMRRRAFDLVGSAEREANRRRANAGEFAEGRGETPGVWSTQV